MATTQYEHVDVPPMERQFDFERLFASDLRRDGLIPASLLGYPELAALEAERVRLAAALTEAEAGGGWHDEASYVRERARALRSGSPLPPPPPTAAERQADGERRRRDVSAATDALVQLGDTLRRTIAAHPEWQDDAAGVAQPPFSAEAILASGGDATSDTVRGWPEVPLPASCLSSHARRRYQRSAGRLPWAV